MIGRFFKLLGDFLPIGRFFAYWAQKHPKFLLNFFHGKGYLFILTKTGWDKLRCDFLQIHLVALIETPSHRLSRNVSNS
jgi:hypothetical protein